MNEPIHQPIDEFGRERLATKRQIAHLLQVTPRTVEMMMSDGRIPFVRYGRTVRFNVPDVLAAGKSRN